LCQSELIDSCFFSFNKQESSGHHAQFVEP